MNEIWKEELVDLCRGAIQLPSPSGQEKEMADYVEAAMNRFGFDSPRRPPSRNRTSPTAPPDERGMVCKFFNESYACIKST